MPWPSNSALPPSVRDALPAAAQTVFRSAANSVFERGGADSEAVAAGWAAVKNAGWRSGPDGWAKASEIDMRDIIVLDHDGRSLAFTLAEIVAGPEAVPSPEWVDALREGRWKHPEWGLLNITRPVLQKMVENFRANVIGRVPHGDYNHATYEDEVPPHEQISSGDFSDMKLVEIDGEMHLFVKMTWTSRARAAIGAREFRYISPVFEMNYTSKDTGKKVGPVMESLALTNIPFLTRLRKIAASERVFSSDNGVEPPLGGNVQKLIELFNTLGLGFTEFVAKLQEAGAESARELAALTWLFAKGEVPDVNAATVNVTPEVLKEFAPEWAAELETAGIPSVTLTVPAVETIAALVGKLNATPEITPDGEPAPPVAPVPAVDPGPAPKEITVTTTTGETKKFTEADLANPEKVKAFLTEVFADKPEPEPEEIVKLREQVAGYRKAEVDALLLTLTEPNEQGMALPPVALEYVRLILAAKPDDNKIILKEEKKDTAGKVTEAEVSAADISRAILVMLAELKKVGLVKLDSKTRGKSVKPGDPDKEQLALTEYTKAECLKMGIDPDTLDPESARVCMMAEKFLKGTAKDATDEDFEKPKTFDEAYVRARLFILKEKNKR